MVVAVCWEKGPHTSKRRIFPTRRDNSTVVSQKSKWVVSLEFSMSFHGCGFQGVTGRLSGRFAKSFIGRCCLFQSFLFPQSFHRAELVGAQLGLRQIGEEVSHNRRRWRRATLAAKIMIQSTSLTENGGTGDRIYLYLWTAVWKAIDYIIIGRCGDSTVFPKPILHSLANFLQDSIMRWKAKNDKCKV